MASYLSVWRLSGLGTALVREVDQITFWREWSGITAHVTVQYSRWLFLELIKRGFRVLGTICTDGGSAGELAGSYMSLTGFGVP